MNLDYFDNVDVPAPDSVEQKQLELKQLQDIADKIGSYYWSYKEDFAMNNGVDTKDHIGPIAQQLLSIPGLESAVIQDKDGTLKIDTQYLSLATFSMLAALARFIGIKGENEDGNIREELVTELPDVSTTENIGAEGAGTEAGAGAEENVVTETVQPTVETDQTVYNEQLDRPATDTATVNEEVEV